MRENKNIVYSFRDKESLKNVLKEKSEKKDMNVSEFIRYCVYKEIYKEV